MKIVFLGTPEFGAIVLKGLVNGRYKPALVIAEPDKPVGRKQVLSSGPVKSVAQSYGIPISQPEEIKDSKSEIKNLKPDLIVVAAYGQIIPKDILEIPKYGALNVHPSLLPKYRGPSPIQSAILNGEEETGVSVMVLDEKMDHGPILLNSRFKISDSKMTFPELHDKLAEIGTDLLLGVIPKLVSGKIKAFPQNDDLATYTKILKKEDGKIDWKKPADLIERQIRAFYPWPGSFTDADGKLLKIWKAKIQTQDKNCPSGSPGKTFMATNEEIAVQTGQNFLIIEELQLEGKNRMKSSEFLKGRLNFIGTILK